MQLRRHSANPILTRASLPAVPPDRTDASAVTCPAAVRFGGGTMMVLRARSRGWRTLLLCASGRGAVGLDVSAEPLQIEGLAGSVHDLRLTALDGSFYLVLTLATNGGPRLVLVRTDDFRRCEPIADAAGSERWGGALFPERIGGRCVRVEGLGAEGPGLQLAVSDDLLRWDDAGPLLPCRADGFDERVAVGPPPVKTRDGWLLLYRGTARHAGGPPVHHVGAALLDLADPCRVLARTRDNVLEPRAAYEQVGHVPNALDPAGLLALDVDDAGFARPGSDLRLYYGAAQTSVALATTTVRELLAECRG